MEKFSLKTIYNIVNLMYIECGGEDLVKSKPIPIRLDEASERILTAYCDKHGKNRAQAIREAIQRLDQDESNYFWSPDWKEKLIQTEKAIEKHSSEVQNKFGLVLRLIEDMRLKLGSEENEEIQD